MFVLVTPAAVTLEDPGNLRQFHVQVDGDVDVDAALRGAGYGAMAEHDALVSVEAVRAAAAGRVDAGWPAGFEAMLEFARGKGWLSEDGTAIQAHVERAGAN